jgi:hypothetical protein
MNTFHHTTNVLAKAACTSIYAKPFAMISNFGVAQDANRPLLCDEILLYKKS